MSNAVPDRPPEWKRRVLLTGASGTLGFNIARLLATDVNCHLLLPVRRPLPYLAALGPQIELVPLELRDKKSVEDLLARTDPDVIVHCAASGLRPPRASWFELISFNVETTLRLFESYCLSRVSHFIHVGTGLVYRPQGRPIRESDPVETLHPYGASKAAADLLLQAAAVEFGRTLTIIRPFGFTGLQDFRPRLFPSLLHAALAREPFAMTSGEQIRDFCAVEDIAQAIVLSIDRVPEAQIEKFNLGGGGATRVRQLVETVCSELGLQVQIQFGQNPSPPYDPAYLVADISAARQALGWYPTTRLSYAVWELAQEMAPELSLQKPERSLWLTAANSR
jgi:nucleoside-diphosphate-sugar epimerase